MFSQTATKDRLAELQASGAIAQFTIVEREENDREIACLLVTFERGARCVDVTPHVQKLHAVETLHPVTGVIGMIVYVAVDHVEVIERRRAAIADLVGVADVSTHVVLKQRAT